VKKIVRVFLYVLGSVWFFPVSCTVGMIVGEPISESLDAWTPDRSREPPSSLFFVLAQETPDAATITGLPLQSLDAFREKFPQASFLLPASQGEIAEFKYSVVTLGETTQEVTVHYAQGNDYHSLSVYRAEGREILPLYHRWGGGPGGGIRFMTSVFPVCLFLSGLICFPLAFCKRSWKNAHEKSVPSGETGLCNQR
jgi:hypothetical protein